MTRKQKSRRALSDELDDDLLGVELDDDDPRVVVDEDGWPINVPVLTPGDLVWNWNSSRGQHDLLEWLNLTFDLNFRSAFTPQRDKAYRVLCRVISERFEHKVRSMWLFLEHTKKHKKPSLEWQAACWNEMLVRLGYGVPGRVTRDPGLHGR